MGCKTTTHERGTRARRPRHVRGFWAKLVGTVGMWLHFARGFGRGRRAEAFTDTPLQTNWRNRTSFN